jgi:CHAT domain-containing protein
LRIGGIFRYRINLNRKSAIKLLLVTGVTAFAAAALRIWSQQPSRLVAAAYQAAGTIEFRFPGTIPAAAPLRPASSDQLLQLARAKEQISTHLTRDQANPAWVEAGIALDLLRGDRERALHSLARASDYWPDNPAIQLYQAIGYAEEAAARKREDLYGLAYDRLSQVIRGSSEFRPIALFNRAVVDEKMFLFGRAAEDWQRYLEIDSATDWKLIAQKRKDAVYAHLASSDDRTPVAQVFLREFRSHHREENPLERVVEATIRGWTSQPLEAAGNLRELAGIAFQEHGDPWLRDLLSGSHSSNWTAGMAALSRSSALNAAGERNPAAREADKATESFHRAGNPAGRLGAAVEKLYAVNRSLTVKACFAAAEEIGQELEAHKYSYLLVRYRIEMSGCQGRGDFLPDAEVSLKKAMATARAAHYPGLELRTLTILANLHITTGNSTEAWEDCWAGINRFWTGSYGAVRGHSLYYNCSLTAERLGHSELPLAFAQEASRFASQISNRLQAAEGYFREGLLAARMDDPEASRRALNSGKQALETLPDDDVRARYQWAMERAVVEGDLRAGRISSALQTLSRFGDAIPRSEQPHERANYYLLRARAAERAASPGEQFHYLKLAAAETERSLVRLSREDDRIRWRNQSGAVFRPLVELTLSQPDGVQRALSLWEGYLDRTVNPGAARPDEKAVLLGSLQSTTLLSFVWLTDHVGYWVADDRGVDFVWLSVSAYRVAGLCRRFARECSDEEVPEAELRRTARELSHAIFDPARIAPAFQRLKAGRHLLIETDSVLGSIPFEALVDAGGRYLAESHAIVYSPGLHRWDRLRASAKLSPGGAALIVAAPAVTGSLARQFPPLPDARREGEMVAGFFKRSTVLAGRNGTLLALHKLLDSAELFHFSGHGLSNSEDGALLLASTPAEEDGSLLTTAEIANQALSRCRLAVLSACSSGVGESRGPVNPNSLVNGLLRAGVRDVVASRWKVDSGATYTLMRCFYRTIIGTGETAEALQEAAREVRGTAGMGHPHYWASFSTFGE